MRLGIFGGSFDPPHLGHLLPVIDAAESLGLDAVHFVPAAMQPFKAGRARAAPEHRLSVRRMVELCRRVIRVSRSIEGIGVDPDEIAMLRDAEVTGQ